MTDARLERELLARAGRGDQQGFRALAARLAPAALGLATRVTANRDLAEEAVQEAFLEVWRRAGRYDERRGGVRGWIMTVVHHKAVDAVRRERAVADSAVRIPEPAAAPDPELSAEESDRRDRVLKALDQLSPVQREAITLAYFGGLTYRQVAERLAIPEGTAKSRLRDGLLTLRGLLETYGVEMAT
jgi:RNA polymerase sigma-70 factor, ECF subfamily